MNAYVQALLSAIAVGMVTDSLLLFFGWLDERSQRHG